MGLSCRIKVQFNSDFFDEQGGHDLAFPHNCVFSTVHLKEDGKGGLGVSREDMGLMIINLSWFVIRQNNNKKKKI